MTKRTRAWGLLVLLSVINTGCGSAPKSAEEEKKNFMAAPDYNKLTPEQKKMVAAFSHGQAGKTTQGGAKTTP